MLELRKVEGEKDMITLFNRKELIITRSMNEQARIRNLLAEKNIDYIVKTSNRAGNESVGRGMRTAACTEENAIYEYKIYVKKEDYEKARGMI